MNILIFLVSFIVSVNAMSYEVYQGCAQENGIYSRTITLDPKVESLSKFLAAKKLKRGDHLIMTQGDHGIINIGPMAGSQWIWLDFQSGAKAQYVELTRQNNILLSGAELYGPERLTGLVHITSGKDIIVHGNKLSGGDSTNWDVNAWLNAPNGIFSDNAQCVSITNNILSNIRSGISAATRATTPNDENATALKTLIKGNSIDGLSGDGIRSFGGYTDTINNTIVNGMLDGTLDGNHDDFYQIGTKDQNLLFANINVMDNVFISANKKLKYPGKYQGISQFDGCIKNLTIKHNIVLGGAYHMIAAGSVDGALIEGNTVMNMTDLSQREYGRVGVGSGRCAIPGHSTSKNVVVKNNVSNLFKIQSGLTVLNNIAVSKAASAKAFVVWDIINYKFDLHPIVNGPLYGKGAGYY